MPGHRYERVPHLDNEDNSRSQSLSAHNNTSPSQHHPLTSYFTGLPSTAPPSFHSIASAPSLPHRNDETAATIIPLSSRPSPMADDSVSEAGISLWGSSDSTADSDRSAREKNLEIALIQCLNRVAALEARLDASSGNLLTKNEADLESLKRQKIKERRDAIVLVFCIMAFIFGLGWWILALVRAKHGTGRA